MHLNNYVWILSIGKEFVKNSDIRIVKIVYNLKTNNTEK